MQICLHHLTCSGNLHSYPAGHAQQGETISPLLRNRCTVCIYLSGILCAVQRRGLQHVSDDVDAVSPRFRCNAALDYVITVEYVLVFNKAPLAFADVGHDCCE